MGIVLYKNYDDDGELKYSGRNKKNLIKRYLKGEYELAFIKKSSSRKNQIDLRRWFRDWLLELANYTCQNLDCGWREFHPVSRRPLVEVHHHDGDKLNCMPENLIVLCPNCHSLTYNYMRHGKS